MRWCSVLLVRSDECGWDDLRKALNTVSWAEMVGEASDGRSAIRLAETRTPDVVIAPSHLDGDPTVPLLAALRDQLPTAKLILVASRLEVEEVAAYAEIGIAGHLLWSDISTQNLPHLLASASVTNVYVASREVVDAFITFHRDRHVANAPPIFLNTRERDMLRWLSEGLTHDEIGQWAGISRRSVERTIETLKVKFNAETLYVLGMKAAAYGLVEIRLSDDTGGKVPFQ